MKHISLLAQRLCDGLVGRLLCRVFLLLAVWDPSRAQKARRMDLWLKTRSAICLLAVSATFITAASVATLARDPILIAGVTHLGLADVSADVTTIRSARQLARSMTPVQQEPDIVRVAQAAESSPLFVPNMPPARRGEDYSFRVEMPSSLSLVFCDLFSGSLPAGMGLHYTQVWGKPWESGNFSFTVSCSGLDRERQVTILHTLFLTVEEPTLIAAPPGGQLPTTQVGISYSQTFSTLQGTGPYTYDLAGGELPPGMTLSTTGTLSGKPTQSGSYRLSVRSEDSSTVSSGGPYRLTTTYDVDIQPPYIDLIQMSGTTPQVGSHYEYNFGVRGGTPPYTFAVSAGALPAGLTLNTEGILSGIPTEGGNYDFTITARDSSTGPGSPFTGSRRYFDSVLNPTIVIAPAALPPAIGGRPYAQTLTASGGTPPYSFSIAEGALPAGVSLAADGTLSGTPTVAGSFALTATALDSSTGGYNPGGRFAGHAEYTLSVGAPTILIDPETLPAGRVAATYSQTLTASGGNGKYSFAVATGALPAGLTLTADGILSGIPTAGGAFGFTAKASDENGFSGTRAYSVTIDASTIALAPATVTDATRNIPYSATFTASGGTAPYSFAVSAGALPAGLTLAPDGKLSGTPKVGGTFRFTVTATDFSTGSGPYTGFLEYVLTVGVPDIQIRPGNPGQGKTYVPFNQVLTASGGAPPYTFAVSAGALPTGITLAADGTLSGVATQNGSFGVTVTVTDANGNTGEGAYALAIDAPVISLSPGTLPQASIGTPYNQAIQASGGRAPYVFALSGGTLPNGLVLGTDGVLSGAPTSGGTFEIAVQASDSNGFIGTAHYSINVDGQFPSAANASVTILAGTSVNVDLTAGATGGPFTGASIVSQSDPQLGSATIERTGPRPSLVFVAHASAAGRASISFTLSNATGVSNVATVTILVEARPDPSFDPDVVGLLNAQASTAGRFVETQITNFGRRLEQLHNEGDRRSSSMDLRFSIAQGSAVSALAGQSDGNGGQNGSALAYAPSSTTPPSVAAARAQANNDRNAEPAPYQRDLGPVAVWTGGFFNFGQRDNGGIDLDYTMIGVSAGVDYRFSDAFVGGFGVGYGRDKTDIGSRGSESRATAFSGALYGSYTPMDNVFIDGLVGAGMLDFQSRRFIAATSDYATGGRSGSQIFAALTAGYEHRDDNWLISPYGRIEASRSWLDGFTETGGGIYGLTYGDQMIDSLSGVIGLRANYRFDTEFGALMPGMRAEYTHDFAGSSRSTVGYSDVGTLPFATESDPLLRNQLSLGLSLDWQINDNVNLGLDYQTSFGVSAQDHRIGVKLGGKF